jgi:hypothetical protein
MTIIHGLHPSGCHYQLLNEVPPIEIDFTEIKWPEDWALPWRKDPYDELIAAEGEPYLASAHGVVLNEAFFVAKFMTEHRVLLEAETGKYFSYQDELGLWSEISTDSIKRLFLADLKSAADKFGCPQIIGKRTNKLANALTDMLRGYAERSCPFQKSERVTDLQDKTQLTRRSIYRILVESGRLDDFKRNPQQFIELAAEIINRAKRMALVDGIKYQRIGADEYYAQQLFETEELTGYLKTMVNVEHSVHEKVIYQSDTERTFAEQLDKNEAIKVFAKLPGWFKVPTPLGAYNPDWAVLVDKDGSERLYFVVETKSSLFTDDLRDKESAKIKCGEAHFAELAKHNSPAAKFIKATKLDDVLTKCSG